MEHEANLNGAPWPAPAKINLFLHVTGRRADGYHELQTVFQFLDICDYLHFTLRADGRIRRLSELPGVAEDADLVVRAARRLRRESGLALGVDIEVDKRLPMGGGLGGGSSDAATVLVALNHLWGLGYAEERLAAMALELGADVPVFVHGRAAWAEGVGERLTFVEPPQPWYLVVSPDCSVSTAEIFGAPDLTRDSPAIKIADFLSGAGRNDCEPVVRARYPAVARALDWFGPSRRARVTGTGACVFCPYETEEQARAALRALPKEWRGFAARGLNRSPLLDRLQKAQAER